MSLLIKVDVDSIVDRYLLVFKALVWMLFFWFYVYSLFDDPGSQNPRPLDKDVTL